MEEKSFLEMSDEEFLKSNPEPEIEEKEEESVEDTEPLQEDDSATSEGADDTTQTEEIDYKAFYDAIMSKPIKANGVDITPRTSDEVVSMIQKGANYTKKMQEIAPDRKALALLRQNGLLEQDTLNTIVDVFKNKNPKAISKLLKDGNINTFDLDVISDEEYKAPNYNVSEEQLNWKETLDSLSTVDTGKKLLSEVADWDQKSVGQLYEDPRMLEELHNQVVSGRYQEVMNQVARAREYGYIKPNTPMLEAYIEIGQRTPSKVTQTKSRQDLERVKQAGVTRSTKPIQRSNNINYMAMSDEEFMKLYKR